MELNEGVIAELDHTHEGHSEETCAFCTSPPTPSTETNDLTDKADEDADEMAGLEADGIAFKNKADVLGAKLEGQGSKQLSGTVQIDGVATPLPVHSAAHHLIPGNASLKTSQLLPHLHTEGKATGNIGYDVNNFENGVWLGGNYALRGKEGLPSWGPAEARSRAQPGRTRRNTPSLRSRPSAASFTTHMSTTVYSSGRS